MFSYYSLSGGGVRVRIQVICNAKNLRLVYGCHQCLFFYFVLTFGEVQIMDLLYVVFGPFTTKKKLKDVGRR